MAPCTLKSSGVIGYKLGMSEVITKVRGEVIEPSETLSLPSSIEVFDVIVQNGMLKGMFVFFN